jgi:cytochrome P450
VTPLRQSPTEPGFVQDPYRFYEAARASGDMFFWDDYGLAMATSHRAVNAILKDRRMGREPPEPPTFPEHLASFYAVEAHSMLELEPPRHTRLRGLVLRAFTHRRIKALAPEIEALCHDLADGFPEGEFDLLRTYAQRVPVIVIARLLGVPETMSDQLLAWSNAMVAVYQARRTPEVEVAAASAAAEFSGFMRGYVEERRTRPADDLMTHLIAAEEDGEKLSTDELITTCILLLNAGHEATVHSIGNGVKALLEAGHRARRLRRAISTARLRRSCGSTRRSISSPGSSTKTWRSSVIASAGATASAAFWGRRTAIPRSGRIPRASTRSGRCARMSPSAPASTSASARRSRGWNSRSPFRSSSTACPGSGSPGSPPMQTSTTSTASKPCP